MKQNRIMTTVMCLALALPLLASAQVVERNIRIFGGGTWIGVSVSDVTAENLSSLKLKEERGVEVITVTSDGPAAKAGIKEHDVILDYNGTRLEGVEQFKRLISETPAGRNVKLAISRDGVPQTVTVKVEERSGDHGFAWATPMPPTPPTAPKYSPTPPTARAPRAATPRVFNFPNLDGFSIGDMGIWSNTPRIGIEGEELTSQLAEFFGVPDKEKGGVLVRAVTSGGAAEKAGIKAGDVIVKIEGKRIEDMSDLRETVRDNAGKSFSLVVIRNKKEMTLTVKVEKAETRIGERV